MFKWPIYAVVITPLGFLEDIPKVGHLIDVSWCDNLVRPNNSLYLTPQLLLDLWVTGQEIEYPTQSVRGLERQKKKIEIVLVIYIILYILPFQLLH